MNMKIEYPNYGTVELTTDGLSPNEKIVGYVDEYGTITDTDGKQIGDLVSVLDTELAVIIMRDDNA